MQRRSTALAAALGISLAFTAVAHAGPSPVGLGGAGAYAVLGGSGLTNTGVSTIEGDVGSSPTHSQTGFAPCPAANCISLTGANHDVADPNDAVTQQAKSDLVIAYDDAFGRTGGTAVSAPLGAGQTLVAGVYTSATDLFVGGDLTLDGAGDAGAVFIFQAKTGTLNTAAGTTSGIPNTRVLLTNGAQACNVFWQVGSSATIATSTAFAGTILALQSITVNTNATIEAGRVLARNGAVTLDTNVIRAARCATPQTAGTTTAPATTGPSPESTPPASAVPVTLGPSSTPLGTGVHASASGTARLTGPSRPTGPFAVTVTGRQIVSVTYYLDGRRLRTVRARTGRTRLRIDPRGQHTGVHRVRVRVRFTDGSTSIRRITYQRRTPTSPAPRFTG
jgi:hypothetical protein